jgi:hypothetical protein
MLQSLYATETSQTTIREFTRVRKSISGCSTVLSIGRLLLSCRTIIEFCNVSKFVWVCRYLTYLTTTFQLQKFYSCKAIVMWKRSSLNSSLVKCYAVPIGKHRRLLLFLDYKIEGKKALPSLETVVNFNSRDGVHISEGNNLQLHRCENLR